MLFLAYYNIWAKTCNVLVRVVAMLAVLLTTHVILTMQNTKPILEITINEVGIALLVAVVLLIKCWQ